jgi:hypothetical protein
MGMGWSGSAAAEKKRVGVPRFDGPQEAIVRRSVMQVLRSNGYDVVGSREIDAATKTTGAQLDSNDGFKAVAKELAISAYVTGEVSKKKAKLTVRNGSDGAVAGEGSFGGANPKKIGADVRDGFSRRLGSAVSRGRAPSGAKKPTAGPAAEPEEADDNSATSDADEAPPKASKAAESPSKSDSGETPAAAKSDAAPEETVAKKAPSEPADEAAMGPRALDIGVGFGGFSRDLSYNQDLYGLLRQYKLALGPAISLSVVAFPAAFATSSFVANIGLEANVEYAIGVTSSVPANPTGLFPNGATFGTQIHDYNGGVRVRLVLHGGHEIAALAGAGEHAFSFRSGGDGDRSLLNIPDTIYRYVRAGVVARFELPSGMTAGLGAAYRYVLNKGGQISDPGFFPFLAVAGLEVNAMLGYHVTPSIEARFNVNLRRYFYAMHSDKTDLMATPPNSIAGGAVDQYLGFTIGAAYVFGGVTGGGSSSEEPPAESASEPKKKHKKKKKSADDEDDDGGENQGGGASDE